jgi:flagellar motor component MotA
MLFRFFFLLFVFQTSAKAQVLLTMDNTNKSAQIVKEFLLEVRSGKNPDIAADYMAPTILAHQVNAENPVTVTRTPENYTDHVREFLEMYGRFQFEITELIAQENKVYARWN